MTTDPDIYFRDGCDRCPKFATPECKVRRWTEELKLLRGIILFYRAKRRIKMGRSLLHSRRQEYFDSQCVQRILCRQLLQRGPLKGSGPATYSTDKKF